MSTAARPDDVSLQLFERFADRTLPKAEWTHDAHLTVCWVALSMHSPSEVVDRLRSDISAYNTATGVENSDTSGFHETITRFYVDAIADLDALTIDDVLAAPRSRRDAPLRHWSRDRLFGVEARRGWVEPDLTPLPWRTSVAVHSGGPPPIVE